MNLNDLITLSHKNYTVAQILVAEMLSRAMEDDEGDISIFLQEFKSTPDLYLSDYSEYPVEVLEEMEEILLGLLP